MLVCCATTDDYRPLSGDFPLNSGAFSRYPDSTLAVLPGGAALSVAKYGPVECLIKGIISHVQTEHKQFKALPPPLKSRGLRASDFMTMTTRGTVPASRSVVFVPTFPAAWLFCPRCNCSYWQPNGYTSRHECSSGRLGFRVNATIRTTYGWYGRKARTDERQYINLGFPPLDDCSHSARVG